MNTYALWIAAGALALSACGQSDQTAAPEAEAGPDHSEQSQDQAASNQDVQDAVETIAEAFVPEAGEFGVERFKIVYELEGQETGTRTMWVEAHGERVAVEETVSMFGMQETKVQYWDGERSHMKNRPDAAVSAMRLRTKLTEPTSFATTPAVDLERVGYQRAGDKTIAGVTCEHWINENLNYDGCRADHIEFEFVNGAGTDRIIQRVTATEYVEGEGIPDRLKALAQGG